MSGKPQDRHRPPVETRPLNSYEIDCVARAFGFQSAQHLQRVLDGKDPSALQDS